MRTNQFGRALGISLLLALGVPLFVMVAAPIWGTVGSLSVYAVGSVSAFGALLAPTPRKAWGSAILTLFGGLVLLRVLGTSAGPWAVIVGLTFLLAAIRTGVHKRQAGPKGVLIEAVTGLFALAMASLFAGGDLASWSLACWAYLLCQSTYYLWPRPGADRGGASSGRDAFVLASAQVDSILRRMD